MVGSTTALEQLLAQVSDAELEDGFGQAVLELAGGSLREDTEIGWYSGTEIRELLRTRQERRQARMDEEAAVAAL